jgi:hypothetical protein
MYHDLGMGWFHGSFAAAGAGASRAMNSVKAIINFVNLWNLCLAIPKFPDGAGWPSGLNYQIWVGSSITDFWGASAALDAGGKNATPRACQSWLCLV